jgi:hypothetical protein
MKFKDKERRLSNTYRSFSAVSKMSKFSQDDSEPDQARFLEERGLKNKNSNVNQAS